MTSSAELLYGIIVALTIDDHYRDLHVSMLVVFSGGKGLLSEKVARAAFYSW